MSVDKSTLPELPGLRHPKKTAGPFPFENENIRAIDKNRLVQALATAPKIWENREVKISWIANNIVVKYGFEVKL
jgi:hypothetical protein